VLALFLFMQVELDSPCKVNLILNILGKRPDGFHELETVMQPVPIFDRLSFGRAGAGVDLTCNHPELPTDSGNLVFRAAEQFRAAAKTTDGVRIHLEKRIPLAAGLGGGSGNAAITLLGLNRLFGAPLSTKELNHLARTLGSDVPFFLQDKPAIAVGRGEKVKSLEPFAALRGKALVLIHPGFGVSTAWAYKNLARFPSALNGARGRAENLVRNLSVSLSAAASDIYNSLEAPVLEKYPLLSMFQESLRENGALVALMSGSGSTTFAIAENASKADELAEKFRGHFGSSCWMATVTL
jgi:4-diphosphocytidyl-2-C-methyl-D-erythritol kinase